MMNRAKASTVHAAGDAEAIQPYAKSASVAAGTTCELSKDRAGYWVPSLVRPDGTVVEPMSAFAYYRAPAAIEDERIRPFPRDFRLILK